MTSNLLLPFAHILVPAMPQKSFSSLHPYYLQACKHGRVQHLEHLLFYGADMDVRNSCGNTALHVCALNDQEACARVLMFRGADPTLLNYSNQTADQAATIAGNLHIADLILAHNPDDVGECLEIFIFSMLSIFTLSINAITTVFEKIVGYLSADVPREFSSLKVKKKVL